MTSACQTSRIMMCCVIASALMLGGAGRASADEPPAIASGKFFTQYCRRCHSGAEPKGNFRVDDLSHDVADKENQSKWLRVVRQLSAGDMPPQGELQPSKRETQALTDWGRSQIGVATGQSAEQGRAVMRRLNQTEYANTVRDLLQVNVDLEGVLPVDLVFGGFDTSAESLHFSSYQLDSYLTAAELVLDATFGSGRRPSRLKRRIDPRTEISTRRKDVYRHLDDGVAIFGSDLASNIQMVFWKFLTRQRGKYRFRISAYAYQSEKPILFHINGGTNNLGEPPYLIDYFEAPPGKPTVIEFVEEMEAGRNIRLLVDTEVRPRELERLGGAADYRGPGLVVQWVDIEGPLVDDWPPASYRRLLGDLPQAPVPSRSDRREVVSEQPLSDAKVILRKFIRNAFRTAVTDEEVKPFLDRVRNKLEQGDSFEQALRVGLKAVLVSPNFLFLQERVRQTGDTDATRVQPLDDFSLASRLSYFLWSSMPDEVLLQLAEQGELNHPEVLRGQVERMLRDAKAKAFTENFAGQWLGLREIESTLPDRQLYPEYDQLLRYSMVKEVHLFFEEVLKNDLSVANFVASDFTVINGRLAEHYGIPGVQGLPFRKVALSKNSHRGGVMTMAAVLKVTANGTTTSPIVRGAWVLDRMLGTPPSRPPAGVEAVEPDIRGATTIREQLALHRQVTTCSVCHVEIDPPGFALESFDVIGGWRERYRSIGAGEPVILDGERMRYKDGLPVDAADVLPDGRRFDNIDEYKALLLSDKDQLARNLAVKLLTYSTGTPPTILDGPKVEAIVGAVRGKNYGFRSLVHEVVKSELFQNK